MSTPITARIDEQQRSLLEAEAAKRGQTLSALVADIVRQWLAAL